MSRLEQATAKWALFLVTAWLGACNTHFADAIVRQSTPDPPEPMDPCSMLSGAIACAADTVHGCSFQPNPTGCLSSNCGAGVCRSGTPFVTRSGEALFLREAPFQFVGTVSWQVAWQDGGCRVSGYPTQDAALGPFFDQLAAMHVSVLRFWAFQSYAGATGTDYSHFDRVVQSARASGIRLLPVLESYHPDCTANSPRDDAWFATGYTSPYGNYALSYRAYVEGLVDHFKNEPTILAWELMHEASSGQFSVLDAFAADMTALIRMKDTNHLIALGFDNGTSLATSTDGDQSNYFKLNSRDAVGLIDVHDFSLPDEAMPAQIARCRAIAHTLKKPIFAGASAAGLMDTSTGSFTTRAGQIQAKLEAALADDFAGFLVYDFVPGWSRTSNDFDARPEEPLAGPGGVIDLHARRF